MTFRPALLAAAVAMTLGLAACKQAPAPAATALAVHGAMVLTRQEPLTAVLSAAQLGVPVAAVTIGRSLDVVTAEESAALLLSAVVTLVAATLTGPWTT